MTDEFFDLVIADQARKTHGMVDCNVLWKSMPVQVGRLAGFNLWRGWAEGFFDLEFEHKLSLT